MSPEISVLVLVCPLLLLISWLWARPKRTSRPSPPVPSGAPGRAQLQALGQRRVDDMRESKLRLEAWQAGPPPPVAAGDCQTRSMPGRWLALTVQVEPPDRSTLWWPCAITVECPQFLTQRDALPPGGPPGFERALHLRIQTWVQGHSLETQLQGPHRLVVWAYVPDCCTHLEIGYYGRPLLTLPLT